MTEERLNISEPAVMRALAHPARLAILEHLQAGEQATATECAEIVGLSPSATSYHLRAMAKVGLIEEAPSRGDGRERLWRSRAKGYQTATVQDADAETVAAESALVSLFLDREDDRIRRWMAKAREEPPEWYEAAAVSEIITSLTVDELRQVIAGVLALLEPCKRFNRPEPPEDARRVTIQLRAVPLV